MSFQVRCEYEEEEEWGRRRRRVRKQWRRRLKKTKKKKSEENKEEEWGKQRRVRKTKNNNNNNSNIDWFCCSLVWARTEEAPPPSPSLTMAGQPLPLPLTHHGGAAPPPPPHSPWRGSPSPSPSPSLTMAGLPVRASSRLTSASSCCTRAGGGSARTGSRHDRVEAWTPGSGHSRASSSRDSSWTGTASHYSHAASHIYGAFGGTVNSPPAARWPGPPWAACWRCWTAPSGSWASSLWRRHGEHWRWRTENPRPAEEKPETCPVTSDSRHVFKD